MVMLVMVMVGTLWGPTWGYRGRWTRQAGSIVLNKQRDMHHGVQNA